FSIIALRSWCRLTLTSLGWVISPLASPIRHRDAHDFFRRRDAVEHLEDAARAEREHAVPDRRRLELRRRRPLEDHLLEAVVEAHDLVERDAPLVPAAVARPAAGAPHELGVRELV